MSRAAGCFVYSGMARHREIVARMGQKSPARLRPDRMVAVRAVVAAQHLCAPVAEHDRDRRGVQTMTDRKKDAGSRRVFCAEGLGAHVFYDRQVFYDRVIVGFCSNFVDELGVSHFAVWVDDNQGARQQTDHG